MSVRTTVAAVPPLVDPEWLEGALDAPSTRVVDCRTPGAYLGGHVPGAVHIGIDRWLKERGRSGGMVGAAAFAAAMSRAGVSADTTVVAYDDAGGLYAARLWWVLRCWGHRKVALLDGGWHRWIAEGRAVVRHVPEPFRGDFVPRPRAGLSCSLEHVRDALGRRGTVLLDVRRRDEWTGEDAYGNRRAGHLPGAVHMLWSTLLHDAEPRRFRERAEMRTLLEGLGVTPDRHVIVYCQAAIRAAHTAFALTLLGHPSCRVYEGSMSEWSGRGDTPLVLGDGAEPTPA